MKTIEVVHPEVFLPLDKPYRYKIIYGGRSSAKSWTVARKLILRAVAGNERILCTRMLQKSIRQSVHKLLSLQIQGMGLGSYFTVTNDRILSSTGSEFIFLGIKHNTEEIKSTEGVTIVWIEEGQSVTEAGWDIITPTIREANSEIWVTFNTRFKFDHIYHTFVVDTPPPDSLVIKANYHDNPYMPEVLLKQMAHMKKVNYEKYLHVWEGELKVLAEGAIFGKQIAEVHKSDRLTFIPIQKNCEVLTFMDIGKNDETAIWFLQRVGQEYRFIDYYQNRLEEVEHYTKVIRGMNYLYGRHYLPHDAAHERLGMTRNIDKQFRDGGVSPTTIVPRIQHKETAIELAREIFPKCWFHLGKDGTKPVEQCDGYIDWLDDNMNTRAKRLDKGYENLCNYRYKFKEEDNVFHLNPHHDHASNGADAFQCFAQSDLHTAHNSEGDDWSVSING